MDLCVGCTACMSVCPKQCITMEKDKDGFAYPKVTNLSDCIECGACERICPVHVQKNKKGDLPLAYAAFSSDKSIRIDSASGGIFSELAKRIIAKGGAVFGAIYNDTFAVEHCCIENEDDLCRLRGAKYSESNLGNTFTDVLSKLKQGQNVLFSGTPCQVAGLKAFIKKDYSNLFCVDFVCHGVPSPMAWKVYIDYRAKTDANGEIPMEINLRSKNTGWSNYQYSNVFKYKNGIEHSILSSQSLFMKLFVGDYISRPSCENCKFKGYKRVSDITLGDFWGIWNVDPEMDDNKGTSVILVQSEKGQSLWKEISNKIKFKEVSLEQASQQNPSMLVASKANPKRDVVMDRIRNNQIVTCEDLFVSQKQSLMSRIKGKASRLLHKVL